LSVTWKMALYVAPAVTRGIVEELEETAEEAATPA